LRQARSEKNEDATNRIKQLLGEEKDFINKQKQRKAEREATKKLKQQNKERVAQGQNPVFAKKREIKHIALKDKFDKLQRKGQLNKFIDKRTEEVEKKRRKF